MDEQKQDDLLEPIYNSCANIGYNLKDLLLREDQGDSCWQCDIMMKKKMNAILNHKNVPWNLLVFFIMSVLTNENVI